MKSAIGSWLTSAAVHAGAAAGCAWLALGGLSEIPEISVRITCEAENREMAFFPPSPRSAPVFADPVERHVELESNPTLPVEDFVIRGEAPRELAPRRELRPPSFDRPLHSPAKRTAPPAAVESPPAEVANAPPEYPELARRRRCEGSVLVCFDILPGGDCGNVRVAETSGFAILDEAAIEAVRRWRFKPATINGVPVSYSHRVRFTFKLQG